MLLVESSRHSPMACEHAGLDYGSCAATAAAAAIIAPNITDTQVPVAPAVCNSTLIPTLTLDQLHDSLWGHLEASDKRALRLLSRAMRQEVDECVRSIGLQIRPKFHYGRPCDMNHQLSVFPRLQALSVSAYDYPPAVQCSHGPKFAQFLRTCSFPSSQIKHLHLNDFPTGLWDTLSALPVSMHTSLTSLELSTCKLSGPVFTPLVACGGLRRLKVASSEFASDDAVASLGFLAQVESLQFHLCTGSALCSPLCLSALQALTQLEVTGHSADRWSQHWLQPPQLAEMFAAPWAGQLRRLELEAAPWDAPWDAEDADTVPIEPLQHLLRHLKSLEHLSLGQCYNVDDPLAAVLAGMRHLTSLRVSSLKLTQPQPLHRLRSLHVNDAHQQQVNVHVQQLAWLLRGTTCLRDMSDILCVSLAGQDAAGQQAECNALLAVARAMCRCPCTQVKVCWWDGDYQTDWRPSVPVIIQSLRPLAASLQCLGLNDHKADRAAINAISKYLPQLQRLELHSCVIKGALSSLAKHTGLQELELDRCTHANVCELTMLCMQAEHALRVSICQQTLGPDQMRACRAALAGWGQYQHVQLVYGGFLSDSEDEDEAADDASSVDSADDSGIDNGDHAQ